ncbi:hypothetical protein BDW02DRAFT_313856 [Decorospora gaudefroyi]|uniref:Uncharacterized protein n=1 Tax=Decorospora gaudefroyi TaxID=184978 RepID=A0A6A5KHK9_9PLEO|nr:hypothetical protein BDW02DRAFT_313856 [Decorospora gaudefroyi]
MGMRLPAPAPAPPRPPVPGKCESKSCALERYPSCSSPVVSEAAAPATATVVCPAWRLGAPQRDQCEGRTNYCLLASRAYRARSGGNNQLTGLRGLTTPRECSVSRLRGRARATGGEPGAMALRSHLDSEHAMDASCDSRTDDAAPGSSLALC